MAKEISISELNNQYELVCNEMVKRFVKKQSLEFDGWVADEVGGIADFISQYYFNLNDIVLDLTTKQKKGFILQWQNDGVDYNTERAENKYINYKSYIMGLSYGELKG